MKKLFISFLCLFLFSIMFVHADTTYANLTTEQTVTKINEIGQKVLTTNELPKEVTFNLVESEEVNAYADADNQITVYTGLVKLIENDDEMAGILSHEVGHIMKSHCYKQSFFNMVLTYLSSKVSDEKLATGAQIASSLASNKISRDHEYDADYTSADLIYKSGYNPLGLVSALNKISTDYIDIMADHPSGSKRLMALYDYINYNYPQAVEKGMNTTSYESFLKYAQKTINDRNVDVKKMAKYENTQSKLKQKRLKAAEKMMKKNDPWAIGYSTLKLLSTQNSSN